MTRSAACFVLLSVFLSCLANQSPVAIVTESAVLSDWALDFQYGVEHSAVMRNDGNTVRIEFSRDTHFIVGDQLCSTGRGVLDHAHIHWALRDGAGSEHLVDYSPAEAEVHFVHYCTAYSDVQDAINSNDRHALIVVGFLLRAGDEAVAPELESWVQRHVRTVRMPLTEHKVEDQIALNEVINNGSVNELYSYTGSLTTPPYSEVVHWHLARLQPRVSHGLLDTFRETRIKLPTGDDGRRSNWRSLQFLGDRQIERNFRIRDDEEASKQRPRDEL